MQSEPWFDELRASYAASLPAKISCLRELTSDVVARPHDWRQVSDLAHALHRLAGSAGSYGFPDISSALGPWVRLVMSASTAREPVGSVVLAELHRCLGVVAARAQELDAPASIHPPAPGPTRVPRIAVFDDNVDDRRFVRAMLELHYEVVPHAAGMQALEIIRGESADLVMVNVSMSGMSGLEFVRRLRADPSLRHVPAIALTTHADADDRRRLLAAGFDRHVPKPITNDTALIEAIEQCLRGVVPQA
jgi:CheY-like chemotaxis protein